MNQFDWVCYRGYSGTRRRTRTETYYDTQVKYEYIVKNVTFSSDKISHVKIDTTCRDCAYAVRNKYKKGSVVQVHYNPEQPDEAVLEAGLQAGTFLPLVMGIFACMLGILFLLLTFFGKEMPDKALQES